MLWAQAKDSHSRFFTLANPVSLLQVAILLKIMKAIIFILFIIVMLAGIVYQNYQKEFPTNTEKR